MKLQQLQYYVTTCQFGNMSKAAEQLHISQPSISAAIKELEHEFDVELISKRYQGFSLTKEGIALKEMAEGLLMHANHVSERMMNIGNQRRPVRLGIPPMIGTNLLPRIYGELNDHDPDIILATEELGSKYLLHEMQEDTFDLVFISHNAPLPKEFKSVLITTTEVVWCTLSEHPLAQQKSVSVEQLKYEPLVFFKEGFSVRDAVLNQFEAAAITPFVIHTTGQLSTIHSLIQDGMCTGFILREAAEGTDFVAIPLNPPVILHVSLVWKRSKKPFKDMEKCIHIWQKSFTESKKDMVSV